MLLKDIKVDTWGNAYILGKVFNNRVRERRKGKPNYKYHIFSYRESGADFKEFIIELSDQFITDLQFEIDWTGDIVATGFYSDKGSTSIKGSFFMELDAENKTLKNKHFKDFEFAELADFLNEKQAEKGRELYEYDLKELILRDDGGAYLIAEQFYIKVTSTGDPQNPYGLGRTDYKYYYNDIGVVNIDPSGKIKWIKRIRKRQVSSNDEGRYSSFAFSRYKNQLFLIFNDNPKNLNNQESQKVYNFQQGKNSTVVLVRIDDTGNITKSRLFDTRESNIITRPKVSEQVSSNEMIIYGQWKKNNRLARLTFE